MYNLFFGQIKNWFSDQNQHKEFIKFELKEVLSHSDILSGKIKQSVPLKLEKDF